MPVSHGHKYKFPTEETTGQAGIGVHFCINQLWPGSARSLTTRGLYRGEGLIPIAGNVLACELDRYSKMCPPVR